jgi:hypothetical protein
MKGEALYPMNIIMSEKGDVAVLGEVIRIYAQHHECCQITGGNFQPGKNALSENPPLSIWG